MIVFFSSDELIFFPQAFTCLFFLSQRLFQWVVFYTFSRSTFDKGMHWLCSAVGYMCRWTAAAAE